MGLRRWLRKARRPRGEMSRPLWRKLPELARPIEGTPFVTEDIDTVMEHYMTSPGFVTTDRYPPEVLPPKGEIGYWAIFDGVKIYPVARVIVREEA